MKNIKNLYIAIVAFATLFLASCSKDETNTSPNNTGSVTFEFEYKAGAQPFEFGTEYTNSANEKMKFTMFDFFISNVVLYREDGSKYVVPRDSSYYLIKYRGSVNKITIPNVPIGTYTEAEFMIGVDSAKQTEDYTKFTGALELGQGMNWTWNTGFIFVKSEGTFTKDTVINRPFKYHIGLFGKNGTPNNTRIVKLKSLSPSESKANVSQTVRPTFHFIVDVLGKFNAPNQVRLIEKSTMMADPMSNKVADNYAQGLFRLDHIHN